MDVSKFRKSANVNDLRGQPMAAATVIRGRPPKEVTKKAPLVRTFDDEAAKAVKRWSRK